MRLRNPRRPTSSWMVRRLRINPCGSCVLLLVVIGAAVTRLEAARLVLHLKNGDRLTGTVLSETTNSITLGTPFMGSIQVPLTEVTNRLVLPEEATMTNSPAGGSSKTNTAPPTAVA